MRSVPACVNGGYARSNSLNPLPSELNPSTCVSSASLRCHVLLTLLNACELSMSPCSASLRYSPAPQCRPPAKLPSWFSCSWGHSRQRRVTPMPPTATDVEFWTGYHALMQTNDAWAQHVANVVHDSRQRAHGKKLAMLRTTWANTKDEIRQGLCGKPSPWRSCGRNTGQSPRCNAVFSSVTLLLKV